VDKQTYSNPCINAIMNFMKMTLSVSQLHGDSSQEKKEDLFSKDSVLSQENFFMNTQPVFEELLKLLEENNVEYMVVGGYAVAFYGYPRFTKDIDILYNLEKDNINKIKSSLIAFGFSEKDLPDELFTEKGNIIKFGIDPVRIDLLNEIDGVYFGEIAAGRVRGRYGKIEISFISKKDLIINKRASGRAQDLADIENLESS